MTETVDLAYDGAPLAGRHALVTGGARGIGKVIAATLKSSGARVTILGRTGADLDSAVGSGAADASVTADVTDQASVDAAIGTLIATAPPIDILVTNAGGASTASYARTDAAAIGRMIDVNLLGCTRFVAALAPVMVERGSGRVVAIASTAGLKGYGYVSAYVAAKHAVVGYVRAVAAELAKTGVTINAVCPGFTDTDLVETSIATIMRRTGRSRQAALDELVKHNPQGRLIDPLEVAEAVAWLCRSSSSSINGQAIAVAGGEI